MLPWPRAEVGRCPSWTGITQLLGHVPPPLASPVLPLDLTLLTTAGVAGGLVCHFLAL